ncbi:MAG: DNA-protecting protein DprA [Ignavibacteriae bacterium]|nr:MAG: DNA-protecting protein DprA [Ignavibacteriota bacterium]
MLNSQNDFIKLRVLSDTEGVGASKVFNLLAKFNSIDNLFNASFQNLIEINGISNKIANRLLKQIDEFKTASIPIKVELEKLDKLNARWTTYWSDDYPKILKEIYFPPIILYYKGTIKKEDSISLAVVGTRVPTRYGKTVAENFAKELSDYGITVVSGMARGIDSFAHAGALKGNGRTIAVIGSGLDVIYPAENNKLFEKIAENGAVISEYILGTKPDAQNFPKRNRIISGLSLGTLVVETKRTGGALQTASFALDQNREVFAIPGNIGSLQSEGTNKIIQKGEAKLVTCIEDILTELNLKIKPEVGKSIPKPAPNLNIFEQKIFDVLSNIPKHIDKIADESKINSAECLVHLLSLEFRDLVKQLPGKNFVKD